MFEAKLLIPVTRDDTGAPHDSSIIDRWESELIDRFGGFTRSSHPVTGVWVDDNGNRVSDGSYVYYLATDHDPHVKEFAQRACDYFGQQCVYARFRSGNVRLVRK